MIDLQLNKLKKKLSKSNKQKLICISTTANKNNDDNIIASIRETRTTIAGNVILKSSENLKSIIKFFDGFVEYFLIDPEIKNELTDLQELALKNIAKSKYLIYKPNDFTVNSLDMFIAAKSGSIINKNILIVGAGNIGSKAALSFCEREANIFIFDIDIAKAEKIAEALNLIKRSKTSIKNIKTLFEINNIDILIGCTPGIPVLDDKICSKTKDYIIDAGNGTLTATGISKARQKDIPIFVLSSFSGYLGMINNWIKTIEVQSEMKSKKISDSNSIISVGMLGAKGDIIVDNVENITKVIGICDGKGDILYKDDAINEIDKIPVNKNNNEIINKIKSLYTQ